MKRTFVSVFCLFAFLLLLGSCGNPNNPGIQNKPDYQEDPGNKVPPDETTTPDDSENSDDPDDPDIPGGVEDPDDSEDPELLIPGELFIKVFPEGYSRYVLSFVHETGNAEEDMILLPGMDSIRVELTAGNWNISARGFDNSGEDASSIPIVQGSIQVELVPGETAEHTVILDQFPAGEGAYGTLSYTVEFPENLVRSAQMTLSLQDDTGKYRLIRILDLKENFTGAASVGSITLPPGSYRLDLSLYSLYPKLGKTENLNIYPRKETILPVYHFDSNEFPVPETLNGTKNLQDYLAKQAANTEAEPYLIRVGEINLATNGNNLAENTLKTLYDALSRYTVLDLRDCFGGKFSNITKKVSPNKTNVRAIIFPPVLSSIEVNAFSDCTAMVSIDIPGVTIIKNGAFSGCTKLEAVFMEEVENIENDPKFTDGAFNKCESLTLIYLPKAVKIGKKTFNSCTSLSTVYLPKVTVIGDNAFAGCASLECLILGETPPELGDAVFASTKSGQLLAPEIIYVPSLALETYMNTVDKGWTDDLKAKIKIIP